LTGRESLIAVKIHETRVAFCGVPGGDGYRARCSCGWMGEPTLSKAVALVDCDYHRTEPCDGSSECKASAHIHGCFRSKAADA